MNRFVSCACVAFLTSSLVVGVVSSAASAAPDVPGSPSLTSVTGGFHSVSVAFDAPADGGSPITSYTATCSSLDGGAAGGDSRATSPISVGNLTSGKTYRCSVTATNGVGAGLPSADSDPVVAQGLPGAPTITGITATYTAVSVAVTAPAEMGALPITQYRASCTSSDGGVSALTVSAATPVTVYPLTAGAHYTCTAQAKNAHGFGVFSSASPSVAVPSVATVPGAPAVNSVIPGNGQVNLALSTNAGLTGGSALQGITSTCVSSDGGEPAAGSASASVMFLGRLMIYSLTNGKTYSCAVRSYNANGGSAPALTVSFTADTTMPIVAGAISLTGSAGSLANSGVLTGKITEIDHAGQTPTTAYVVYCFSGTGGVGGINTITRTAPETTFTITGRSKGHLYSCMFQHKQGTVTVGMFSGESNIVNLGYNSAGKLPGPPPSWTVAAGNAKLTFTLATPSQPGTGAILGYRVICTPFTVDGTGTVVFFPDVTASSFSNVVTMTGLTNGRSHVCKGLAFNSYGSGNEFVSQAVYGPFTIPNAPTGTAAAPGNGAATVSWTAPPLPGGGWPTGYTVTPYVAGIAQAPRVFPSTSLAQVVGGLSNGTTYTFRVTARNSAGSGPSSTASAPIKVGTPTAPGNPSASPGSTTATVSWQASTANASAITGYVVTPFISGVAQAPRSFLNVTSATLGALVNGTSYTFKVFAKNATGTGPGSVTTAVITVGAPRAPGAPAVLPMPTLSSTGSLQVSVVVPLDNGAPITSYRVTCVSTNGGVTTSVTGTASPFVVSGGTTGKTYRCSATATNSRGTGPASVASSLITVGAPGAATGVKAIPVPTALLTGGLSVSFTAPANNGALITGYTASCQSTNGGVPTVKSGTSSPLLVTGNTTGKTYRCTVTATNSRGGGTASLATASVVVGAPAAPTGVTVVRIASGQLRTSFTAGATNGSAITSFRVTCTSTNGGIAGTATGAASPITVVGLTTGKTYTCTVIATNARGPGLASSPPAAIIA